MGDVIGFDFGAHNDQTVRHLQGPAICTHCKHEWRVVTPEGITDGFDCPNCQLSLGILKSPVAPPAFFTCNCGSDLYFLTREGAVCRRCGIIPEGWWE